MHEQWRPVTIPEFLGLYEVSNLGNIRSKRCVNLRGDYDRSGYHRIVLQNNGYTKRFLVHRLVAEAFLGPRPDGMTVNHKNGKKADNREYNLEYMTQSENELHSFRELGRTTPAGSKHWNHKLTEDDVRTIRAQREAGRSLNELSQIHNVNVASISLICNRRTWRHI
jgi:hypothetical protein